MAELHITLSDGRKLRHRLRAGPAVIGRDAGCDIPVDDPSTSRRHARFAPADGGYLVEDLGSKNGMMVNDMPASSVTLKNGDRILLGSTLVVYVDEAASATPGSVVLSDEDMTRSHATRYLSGDQRLVLSQRRLQLIYELSGRLTTLQNRQQLLESAMDIGFETLQFERGAVGLRTERGRTVEWPVVRNLYGREGELTISRTLLSRALEHGERAMFTDAAGANTDPTMSMVQHGIRSAMCVPLAHHDEVLGVMYGDRTSTSAPYNDEDIDFFAAIARQVSIGLINNRLLEEKQQMIRLNHDIDLARSIQTALFPAKLPKGGDLDAAALNEPGQRVSGDYYDVIERADGRVWALIADVTGEGVGAALLMANLQAAVRATIDETDDPAALLGRWNKLVVRNTDPSKFITCLLALIDSKGRRLRVASAGHHGPMIVCAADKSLHKLEFEPGFPLGVVEQAEFSVSEMDLDAGRCLYFCYTDGVIEAMNAAGLAFGIERLTSAVREAAGNAPKTMLKQVRSALSAFVAGAPQTDDITMLAVRIG